MAKQSKQTGKGKKPVKFNKNLANTLVLMVKAKQGSRYGYTTKPI